MNEQDTVKLLKECDAGIKMGIDAIDDVLDYVSNEKLKSSLENSRAEHEKLQDELKQMLAERGDVGKDPNIMAKSMSHMKTGVKLTLNESDNTIADLITDGCNMGVKSLHRYINQYKAADDKARHIAERLSGVEEELALNVRSFL